jgi:hypothetical protein
LRLSASEAPQGLSAYANGGVEEATRERIVVRWQALA